MLNAGIIQSTSGPVTVKKDLRKQSLLALQRIMQFLVMGRSTSLPRPNDGEGLEYEISRSIILIN